MTNVFWFRRDLRLRDNPALAAAAGHGPVLGLFVIDPRLWRGAGPARRAWLAASLRSLDASMDGHLCLRVGDPATVLPALRPTVLHLARDFTGFAQARDEAVAAVLPGVGRAVGSPYAVPPGTVRNGSQQPYQVFTPFLKAWTAHGWEQPIEAAGVEWLHLPSDPQAEQLLDEALRGAPPAMAQAGEQAAWQRWDWFRSVALADYATDRDLPAVDGTSRLSAALHFGVLHPRQLLASLAGDDSEGARVFRSELAWREFYADVLWQRPASAWRDLRPIPALTYDEPADALQAWRSGTTGYPIVDAGMRQLLHEGWMHNRVRMIVASFLTKDLHVWWPVGARWFLEHLVDGDVASNNHGWQWVAGTGTDASPYFRVFNPVTQAKKFDPAGDYVRQWIPELRHIAGAKVHEPWAHSNGYAQGYPARIVDHAEERAEALRRLKG